MSNDFTMWNVRIDAVRSRSRDIGLSLRVRLPAIRLGNCGVAWPLTDVIWAASTGAQHPAKKSGLTAFFPWARLCPIRRYHEGRADHPHRMHRRGVRVFDPGLGAWCTTTLDSSSIGPLDQAADAAVQRPFAQSYVDGSSAIADVDVTASVRRL